MKLSDLLVHDAIAIQCHTIPDADTLASGFGLYRYFESMGKKPLLFYGGPPITKPNLTGMVEALQIPVQHAPALKEWDGLLITVDCQYGAGNVARVAAPHVAVIDHHIQEKELPPQCDLRPWLGSCSTLVWDLLVRESFVFDRELSTALYYGLFTDTNSFSEVRHPLDRDMWDALSIDASVIKKLKLSNLSMSDLTQISTALNGIVADNGLRFALIPAPPCDPNILGFISDLSMQVDTVDIAVAYSLLPSGDIKFSVRTAARETKASELAAWLPEGMGSGGGHKEKAGGYIAGCKYAERFGNRPFGDYLEESVRRYCCAFQILDCANAATLAGWQNVQAMRSYRKLPVRLGYVPCAALFEDTNELQVRMLEGDIEIQANEDTILMIGITGEVYPISSRTFARNYQTATEPYAQEFPYPPTVLNKTTGKRFSLQEHARVCISTGTDTVKAMPLETRIKVFTRWDSSEYFSGAPGDWLVTRAPDDFYIVTADIFPQLYARDLTGKDVSALANARQVVKRSLPVRVAFAEEPGILETREGPVAYEEGDALLEGMEGERWPVARARFHERYVAAPEQEGVYLPAPHTVWGVQVQEDFTVGLSGNRGVLRGYAGDWLVQYAQGEYGVVGRDIFTRSYTVSNAEPL